MAAVRRSPLLRAGVVIAALGAVAAMATGALPVSLQCLADRALCNPDGTIEALDASASDAAAVVPTFPPPAMSQRTDTTVPSVKVARAAVTHDDLIAATFAALTRGPKVVPSEDRQSLPERPTTRVVQTTVVAPPSTPAPLAAVEPETVVATAPATTPEPETVQVNDTAGPPRIGSVAVNARSGPAVTNTKLFALSANIPVTVLASENKWLKVDDGKGHVGWVYSEYVVGDATPTNAPDAEPSNVTAYAEEIKSNTTATVLGSGVSVRAGAGSSFEKLFALAGGEAVDITEEKRGWLHIVDSKGRSGWAYSSFFKRGG